jgi:hypothetical protein
LAHFFPYSFVSRELAVLRLARAAELAGNDADAIFPGLRAHLVGRPACREDHESLRALVGGDQLL